MKYSMLRFINLRITSRVPLGVNERKDLLLTRFLFLTFSRSTLSNFMYDRGHFIQIGFKCDGRTSLKEGLYPCFFWVELGVRNIVYIYLSFIYVQRFQFCIEFYEMKMCIRRYDFNGQYSSMINRYALRTFIRFLRNVTRINDLCRCINYYFLFHATFLIRNSRMRLTLRPTINDFLITKRRLTMINTFSIKCDRFSTSRQDSFFSGAQFDFNRARYIRRVKFHCFLIRSIFNCFLMASFTFGPVVRRGFSYFSVYGVSRGSAVVG